SKKMLKIAKKLMEQNNGASAPHQLVRGDVQNLPFPDGAFDLVVSTLSLHHWRSPADGIRECWRVTAPGGQCWIYDLRSDVPASAHAKLLAGEGLSHLLLSWIFKFHGVNPKEFESGTVLAWLSSDATVQTEVHAAYLKLNVEKPLCELPVV
ncbi:MAG: class I SAM-dependent methyltransferase, partial [Sedimentisphaerales bacterium]